MPIPRETSPVRPVLYQYQPEGIPSHELEFDIQLEPPGPDRLFGTLVSERDLMERIRQENKEREPTNQIEFPEVPILSREVYMGRGTVWPERALLVAPNYVCYGRLLFEQRNAERYGWDLGVLHPMLSAAIFAKDLITMPYKIGTNPCRWTECSAGQCLPGDPVPLLLYPPGLSVTGTGNEMITVLALLAIFP
jgi:hypothetical protein